MYNSKMHSDIGTIGKHGLALYRPKANVGEIKYIIMKMAQAPNYTILRSEAKTNITTFYYNILTVNTSFQ